MGVKISDIIEKNKISFQELKNKKIAVDFSNAAYQFLTSIRQRDGTPLMDENGNITSHLQGILSRSANLISQGIKVAYILDGPPPELKLQTQQKRHESKIIAQEKFENAKESGDMESMLKYSRQFTRLTKEMSQESAELIRAMGIPVIQAPSEADAQIAQCCKAGDVWAGSTTDFDVLLHGCTRVVTNLTISQTKKTSTGARIKSSPDFINLQESLDKLELNQDQLISLGILVGTDYHKGIHGIGPKKALKIIREYKTPKNIFEQHPLPGQDWEEVFELFKNMKVEKKYDLEWTIPNTEKVLKILVDKHGFLESRVMASINRLTGNTIKVSADQKGLGAWI